ncbi:hypothetical protein DFH08DRAFT_722561 [Mycena albidolilacea]|uniref:Uncharacterized protein n=1 Tax=Mycena albidolilacea TaxID=1033008 RepID=A0AAD7E8M0_9AGAR|nr:hypothetical protein DFH08DRAFT_722536 [Mycena albidolilacea]KAJ7302876.1 hypothetical protein DFH08DRAFT_722561 [Mycena albidolilacea]
MPGTKRKDRDRNENLKKAHLTLHPVAEGSPRPSDADTDTVQATIPKPLSPTCIEIDQDDSDGEGVEEEEDFLHVEEVADIMTRFIALEEAGATPRWEPVCDSEAGMQEDCAAAEGNTSEASLEIFAQTLQRYHDEALAREKRRRAVNNRSGGYQKKSKKTLDRQRKKRVSYREGGGVFIHQFMHRRIKHHDGPEDSDNFSEPFIENTNPDELTSHSTDVPGIADTVQGDAPTYPLPSKPIPSLPSVPTPQEARTQLDELKARADAVQADLEESDRALNALTWRDQPALRRALKGLTMKAKDKRIDVFFRTRITSMVATVNLYLDENVACTWRQASMLAAKAQGRGTNHARNLRSWIHCFLSCGELPVHCYGEFHASLLEDEDFVSDLQTYLLEVAADSYVSAQHIVDFVQTEEVQQRFEGKTGYSGKKPTIGIRTAQHWLKKLDWRYGKKKKGMYIDGHEWEDVVAYRNTFCQCWKEYEKRMVLYDKDGNVIS